MGAYEELFGSDDEDAKSKAKAKGSTYDELFGEDDTVPAPEVSEPVAPREPSGFFDTLFNGRAQQEQLAREAKLAAAGVTYETPASPGWLLLGGPGGAGPSASMLTKLAQLAKATGINAATSGVQGAIEGFDDSTGLTLEDKASDALASGKRSALVGAGSTLAGTALAKPLEKLGAGITELGRGARNYALGGARAISDIAEAHGLDNVTERMGDLLKKYSPSGLLGQSPKAHLAVIDPLVETSGSNISQLRREIGTYLDGGEAGAGPLMPGRASDLDEAREKLIASMNAKAREIGAYGDEGAASEAGALNRIKKHFQGTPDTVLPGRDVSVDRATPVFEDEAAATAYEEQKALGLVPNMSARTSNGTQRVVGSAPFASDEEAGKAVKDLYKKMGKRAPSQKIDAAVGAAKEELGNMRSLGLVPDELAASGGANRAIETPTPFFEDDAARAAYNERVGLGLEPMPGEYTARVQGGVIPGREGARFTDFEDLGNHKSRYASFARPNGAQSVSDEATRKAAGAAGSTLRAIEDELVAKRAPEPIANSFNYEKQRYGEVASLKEMLDKVAPSDETLGDLGNIFATAVATGAAGGATGLVGEDAGLGSVARNAATGFAGGMGLGAGVGATRSATRQYMGRRASDAGANMLEALGGAMNRAGTTGLQTSQGVGRVAGIIAGGHEHNAYSAVETALQTDPSVLGPYAVRFKPGESPRRVIDQLLEEDPDFRQLIKELTTR